MSEPWADDIELLRVRLGALIERADLGTDSRELAAEALEELAVVVEELQAQNNELVTSRADLEAERERYRSLFETVPDGYVLTDGRGMIREINATAADLLDRPRSRLEGRPLASVVEAADRRAFYAQLSRLAAEGPGAHMTINLSVRDGVTVPANLRASVTPAPEAGEVDIRWLIHDRRSEFALKELRAGEEQLRALVDSAAVGIVLADREGVLIFCNARADLLLARGEDDIEADAWLAAAHPDDVVAVREMIRAACDDGRAGSLRHRLGAANGEMRWVEHGVNPFRGEDGQPSGSVSTLTDVTDEYAASAALEHSRDFNDALLDTVGALVIVLDPEGRIERFNAACEDLTGFPAHEMVGQRLMDTLLPEDERDDVEDVFARLARDGLPSSFENDWLTASGERRRISWTNTALADPDGSVRAVIGTGIDVSEMRRLQARLAQADRLESVGRLAAGIAHDFNNTLATIQLRLDRLARRDLDAESRRDIGAVSATIDHTRGVVGDLVSFSRQQRLVPFPVDVNAETARVMSLLTDLLGDHVVVELDLAEAETIATVDPGRFEQLLTNLVLNARDAMPDGGTLTIRTAIDHISTDEGPDSMLSGELASGVYVRLTVTDTGVGMAPEVAEHIFDPYFTTKPSARGTGLGLATTYGTVTQSGGAIVVESRPEAGATFTVWLPRAGVDAPVGEPVSVRDRCALVVEDDPDVRAVVCAELERLGFEVLAAEDGEAAMARVGSAIDLLITDVQLPGMDGVELAAKLRESNRDLVTLFISGAPQGALDQLIPDGAELLTKPFTAGELDAAVGAASARR